MGSGYPSVSPAWGAPLQLPTLSPGWVWCGSEEVHAGLRGPGAARTPCWPWCGSPQSPYRCRLSLSLRMPIITSAVIPPAKEDPVRAPRGQKGPLRPRVSPRGCGRGGGLGPHAAHSLTLLLLQYPARPGSRPCSLHAHRLLAQGEDLSKVKGALPVPPALGPAWGRSSGCSAEMSENIPAG